PLRRVELERFGAACRSDPELGGMVETMFDRLIPRPRGGNGSEQTLSTMLESLGFDRDQHEQIRAEMKSGRTGLAQNRLPLGTAIEDVKKEDVDDVSDPAAHHK